MKTILLLLAVLFTLPNFAQSNEIYGLTRNNNPNVTYLAKVNTTNGLITDISQNSYSEGIANFSSTVDPVQGVFYFTNTSSFIGIDMNTGELAYDNIMVGADDSSIFQNFIYNEMTGDIVGLERVGTEGDIYLSKIDPNTGIITPISANPLANTTTISVSGAAIDLVNQWFHVFTINSILSIDIATGEVIHQPLFDTTNFQNFNNLFYNPVNNKLYALGRNSNPNEVFLTQVDPITGEVTTISPTLLAEGIALEGSTLDPFAGIYYFKKVAQNSIDMAGVDINTGLEVSNTPFDFSASNGAFFGYFYFGGETRSLLLSNDEFENNLTYSVFPNPTDNIINIEGGQISKINILSPTGQLIATRKNINATKTQLDVSTLAQGLYFIDIYDESNTINTVKFIKK